MYGKIFTSIYNSTLMSDHGWFGVYIFSSMVVLADKNGIVDMDERSLYRTLGFEADFDSELCSFERFKSVIDELCAPDPLSNIQKMEGKRLIPLSEIEDIPNNRGWLIVNYDHYRNKGSTHERNEYTRGYMAAIRKIASKYSHVSNGKQPLKTVSKVSYTDTDTDRDTDTEEKKNKNTKQKAQPKVSPGDYFSQISEDKKKELKSVYENVDVEKELQKMVAWLEANPERKKKNYDRFVNNWLARNQSEIDKKKAYLTLNDPIQKFIRGEA